MAGKRVVGFLTAVAGLFLLAGSAWAQRPRFIVSSTPYPVRLTGVTEAAGDVLLTCSGFGNLAPGTNLSISMVPLTAAITNEPRVNDVNLQFNGGPFPNLLPDVDGLSPSIQLDLLPNTLTISYPNTSPPLTINVGDQIRIRGLRVNVQASGLDFPDQIVAELTVMPPGALQFDNTNRVSIGVPYGPLVVTPAAGLACPSEWNNAITCALRVAETTQAVWTSLAQEALLSNTPPPTHPTQLQILLTNVAGGLTVDVPLTVPIAGGFFGPGALTFNPEASTGCDAAGRCVGAEARDLSLIYNVTGTPDLGLPEHATFPFQFTAGEAGNETVALLVKGIGVQVRLAPISTTPERARFGDTGDRRVVPRFLDRLP